jgi:flagellin
MWNISPLSSSSTRWIDNASWRLNQSTERLSSLRRINSAADDAAGLAISERFLSQMNGERIAHQGAMDGVSLAQTADGALGQVSGNLQRMRELALQSRNGTLNDSDRASLNTEYQQLGEEVNRVIGSTSFNGQKILSSDAGTRQINTGPGAQDTLELTTPDLRNNGDLADVTGGNITTSGSSDDMIEAIDDALKSVGQHRSQLGATERRLEAVADTTDLRFESATRAYDRLVSTDVASTASSWRQAQVQQYAAIAMFRTEQTSMQRLLSLFG